MDLTLSFALVALRVIGLTAVLFINLYPQVALRATKAATNALTTSVR
jgi:hypothetical protein